jgi:hypothetical protein
MWKKKASSNKKKVEKKTYNPAKEGDKRLGNQFWKLRSKHGRDKLFATPELLWQAACEYFEWCEQNPLYETKAFAYQGIIITEKLPIMRAMTLSLLCFYLNCNEAFFRNFKHQLPEGERDFNTVIADIEQTIYNQKFQGASGNLLNSNIIARDLGLADKSEITGKDGKDLIEQIDYSKLDESVLRAIVEASKHE